MFLHPAGLNKAGFYIVISKSVGYLPILNGQLRALKRRPGPAGGVQGFQKNTSG